MKQQSDLEPKSNTKPFVGLHVVYESDVCWYRKIMKPETKITPITKAEAKKLIKRAQRKLKVKELR